MPQGTFVISDISGHSRYLDTAGLQHASNVTARLLNRIIAAAPATWTVAKLEGDAVFFLAEGRERPADVIHQVSMLFRAFLDGVLEIGHDTDCGCGACAGSNRLTLKFVVHSGEYESREIGGHQEAIGPAVVVTHRLLKPGVRIPEYVLFTRDYLAGEEVPVTSEGSLNTELGQVPFAVVSLASVRREFEAQHQATVAALESTAHIEVLIACPAGFVWDALLNPSRIQMWSAMKEIIFFPARAANFGSVYIWNPHRGTAFANVVVSLDGQARQVTVCRPLEPGSGRLYLVYSVSAPSESNTAVTCDLRLVKEDLRPNPASVKTAIGRELQRLKRYCESQRVETVEQ